MGKSGDIRHLRITRPFLVAVCIASSIVVVQGSGEFSFFHPPMLSTSQRYMDIPTDTVFTIECEGRHPLTWKLPEECGNDIWERANVTDSFDSSVSENYKSKLIVEPTNYLDTGYFSCMYNGTTDLDSQVNVTSVYIFVNDPRELFPITAHCYNQPKAVRQFNLAVIECRSTGSTVNVTLWKVGTEGLEIIRTGQDIEYDPMIGFKIYYPSFYYQGLFKCIAVLDNYTQEIGWMLIFLAETLHQPEPRINNKNAIHPVVKSDFNLTCTVNTDLETIISLKWSYPNEGDPRIKMMNATVDKAVGMNNYKFKKISRQLIVTNAQMSDAGVYNCTVFDHMSRTGHTSVDIVIYAAEHPAYVNFTTDINVSQPVIFGAGQDVQFVFTIHAFPSMDGVTTYWLKDGKPLSYIDTLKSNHENLRILAIRNLNRTNAGVYTLCGKIKDTENNISFTLYVKDKPEIDIDQTWEYYMLGHKYVFHCNGYGYPSTEVWWRWKACSSPKKCRPGIMLGWRDADDIPNSLNNDSMTVVMGEKRFEKVAELQVIANQSGHYRCKASNIMGEVHKTIAFIVTDAKDGFELTSPSAEIIERDNVTTTCKASVFNYTRIEWSWKPSFGNDTELPVTDGEDVTVVSSSSVYSHSSSLVFHSIQVDSSGEYICTAWNDDIGTGNAQTCTIYVQAIGKPVLNRSNLENNVIKAKLDTQVDLLCFGSGVPLPTITWFKDKKHLAMNHSKRMELSDNNQRLVIKQVEEKDSGLYQCRVENRGGFVIRNATLLIYSGDVLVADGTNVSMLIVFIIVGLLLLILAFALGRRMYLDRKQKAELEFLSQKCFNKGQLEIFNPNLPFEDQIDLLPYDQCWEFPKERLKLGRTLGQGAFGRVLKAEAIGLKDGEASTIVAVKLLKERADINQRKALMAELKFLIHLGRHLNILNLLGAVTKNLNKGELMVIVEYCCYGNLRHYLLRHRETFINQIDPSSGNVNPNLCKLPGLSVSKNTEDKVLSYQNILGLGVVNPMYGEKTLHYAELLHSVQCSQNCDVSSPASIYFDHSSGGLNSYGSNNTDIIIKCKDENAHVSTCDLLCFAFQCSRGMEYLESRKLIHRDLAARNVLLAKDNVVKICDFGLAKDCYKYSNYVKKGDGPLPIKWMAIESIRDRVFTIKSDIWSFGVLLWEFFTLGGNPYPGIDIDEGFYRRLKNGYRLEKPDFAPDNLYQIMTECWQAEPNQRPDFATLTDKLGSLLEASVRKYYIELNNPYLDMNEKVFNNNDYLQMFGDKLNNYTSMEEISKTDVCMREFSSGPTVIANSHGIHYDNISSVRPVGDGPMPKVPMEVVPMIQLESTNDKWDSFKNATSNASNTTCEPFSSEYTNDPEYMCMASSVDIEDNDSVFLETSSGFHSDYTNSDYHSDNVRKLSV